MYFLNLIDIKLNKYTEISVNEFNSLSNLKYMKEILYHHIQKIQRVLNSMHNARNSKWPKADTEDSDKTRIVAKDLKQNFSHLLNHAEMLYKCCNKNIVVLMSSIFILKSKKVIDQAKHVDKLTFLTFIFVSLSFITSFFRMNVRKLKSG